MTSFSVLLTTQPLFAQESSSKVINEVLFHIQKKAYTAVDLRYFESIKADLISGLESNQQRILKGLRSYDVFVLYTICQNEADALELQIEPKEQTRLELKKEGSKAAFLRANMYLQTKENLFADRDRFNSWFQMLKNKYDYFRKTNSLAN